MAATYELFDRQTANVIGTYPTLTEALAVVLSAMERGIGHQLVDVALGCEDENGDTEVIAAGPQLLEFARRERRGEARSPAAD